MLVVGHVLPLIIAVDVRKLEHLFFHVIAHGLPKGRNIPHLYINSM